MNITEADHTQRLLRFFLSGTTEDERAAAAEAAGYLSERARAALNAGPTRSDVEAGFLEVFPPGIWTLPPGITDLAVACSAGNGPSAEGGGG